MNRKSIIFVLLLFAFCFNLNVYADNVGMEYRWEIILNGENEYKSIILEKDIYTSTLYELKNLRIIDQNEAETPYFVTDLDNTIKETFEPKYNIVQKDRETIITIKKEEINNLKINKITLITNDVFKRSVHSEYFDTVLYNFDFESKKEKNLDIDMKGVSIHNDLVFSINNNNDIPLNIEVIKIEYIKQMLVFKSKPQNKYYITLSTKQLECPKYDISDLDFKKYIMNTALDKCSIGDMVKKEIKPQSFVYDEGKLVFNLLVSTVSLIISVIIVLNFKTNKEKQ